MYRYVINGVGQFDTANIRKWWAGLEQKSLSDGSLLVYRAVARSILRYLAELGDDDARQALRWLAQINIPVPQPPAMTKDPVSAAEMRKIAKALPSDRWRLALDVLRYAGLRASTLLDLGPSNIHHTRGGWWIVFRTKRRRLVELESTEDLCKRLLATPEPWFPWDRHQVKYMLIRTSLRAIGRKVTPHDFRRRFITEVWEAEKDAMLTMQMAGHASLKTTQRYILPNREKMAKVLKRL